MQESYGVGWRPIPAPSHARNFQPRNEPAPGRQPRERSETPYMVGHISCPNQESPFPDAPTGSLERRLARLREFQAGDRGHPEAHDAGSPS